MEKIGGNDVIECWGFKKRDFLDLERTVTHHDRQVQDQRCRLMMNFVQSFTQAVLMHGKEPQTTMTVMLAAEMVDAAWNEARHRGWIIEMPPLDEVV